MRKTSEALPLVLVVAVFALAQVFKWIYEDAAKKWFVDRLKQAGLNDMAASAMSGFAETIPAFTLAGLIVYFLYHYIRREFERSFTQTSSASETRSENSRTAESKVLPIAMSRDSLGSYMRTSDRVVRLDQTIARTARIGMAHSTETSLAYGAAKNLIDLGIKNIAELDALLEANEELVLYTAAHWKFPQVHKGQSVVQLVQILNARRGNDKYTSGIVEAYLAAKDSRSSSSAELKLLIRAAREFVSKTVRDDPGYGNFQRQLESDPIYFQLRPLLSARFKDALTRGRTLIGPGRRDAQMPGIAQAFIDELERIELDRKPG